MSKTIMEIKEALRRMINNIIVFQDKATVTGNGNTLRVGMNDREITIDISGTATSVNIAFEAQGIGYVDSNTGLDVQPWIPYAMFDNTNKTLENTTTLTKGIFTGAISGIRGLRCRISSISGGYIVINGATIN